MLERHHQLLLSAGRLFNEVLARDALLGAIRDFVRSAVDADAVSLLWLETGTTIGRYILAYNEVIIDAPRLVNPLTRRFVSQVIADRKGLLIDDARTDPRFKPRLSSEMGFSVGPLIVIPLIRGGKLRGVLEVARSAGRDAFTREEQDLLDALGDDVVQSLSNAFLYGRLLRVSEENNLLYQISVDLGRIVELDEVLRRILDHLQKIVPYDAAGIYLIRRRKHQIRQLEHRGYPDGAQDTLHLKVGQGIVGWVAETGTSTIVPDVRENPKYVSARPQTRSEMVVPIRTADESRVIGLFNVEADDVDAFDNRDMARLEAFASLASVAIEREWARRTREQKKRIDRELRVARHIQQNFLPRRMPDIHGFEIWGTHLSSIEMSGDYYDVIRITKDQLGLVIADVCGKGVPAALIMASLRAGLLSEVRYTYAIREIIQRVNRFLLDSTKDSDFVTAFYAVLDTKKNRVTYVNAGHNPPLYLKRDGEARWLRTGGTVLGAFGEADYQEKVAVLDPGDVLVMYTDGITEAGSPEGEAFGTERLLETVRRTAELRPRRIGEAIMSDVAEYAGPAAWADDRTLLIVRRPAAR